MAAVWLALWALMLTVAVREARLDGENAWRPWIAEGSSMLPATVFVIAHRRNAPKLDGWLRHGLAALLGQPYAHPPLREIWLYEALKFAVFYLLFTGVMFGWRTYGAWVASRLAAERQARLLQEAQMLQLTQQIQPHFLLNALNTVCSFIHSAPDRAATLLLQLAALLRAATDAGQRPQQALADALRLLSAHSDVQVVGEATDGAAALAMAAGQTPHAMFLDVQMPAVSGLMWPPRCPTTDPRWSS